MSASARVSLDLSERAQSLRGYAPLVAILGIGLLLRLLFVRGDGFHNDIAAFEAWSLTLADHPLKEFFANTSFADYPPGYFFVLWIVGSLYHTLLSLGIVHADPSYMALRVLVKLPAILMDLVDAALIYAIVTRFANRNWALGCAALFAFNPAAIYVSSYWGQVDSISSGLALGGLLMLLVSQERPRGQIGWMIGAYAVLAYSVLIKPQASFVGLLFLAFAFTAPTPEEARRRRIGTIGGIAVGFTMAYACAAIFHNVLNPLEDFRWLLQRYEFAASVYQYNSVNAFNLYALKQSFWQLDSQPMSILGINLGPMSVWGWLLTLAASGLIVARYVQKKTNEALLEGAMLATFAFFILSTRMHERYVFTAFVLVMPLAAIGRRYLYAAFILSGTLLANIGYSLYYQSVMEAKIGGVDATNLLPLVSRPLSALNVGLFFFLGYVYLGGRITFLENFEAGMIRRILASARSWFDPREGVVGFRRIDYLLMGAFTLASFVLCVLWLQWPVEKVFDEIYYARAGEEYLKHVDIFEFTHPPFTKLVITLSMMLFGGLSPVGDSGLGWRFLNVVVGALMVGVTYAFGKRLTGSTIWASVAAGLLLFDGFHYAQSRIATPEITVALLSLSTLYAFYRYWIAAQVRTRRLRRGARGAILATIGVGTVVAFIGATYLATLNEIPGIATANDGETSIGKLVVFLYIEGVFYLIARLLVPRFFPARSRETSYADGTRVRGNVGALTTTTPEGDIVVLSSAKSASGTLEDGDGATRTYAKDGSLVYATPAGTATFAPQGTLTVGEDTSTSKTAWQWLVLLSISGGFLAASKWNGLFDFFVVWGCAIGVVAQQFFRRRALFGNPFGFPLDIVIALMLVVAATIYTLCYIPYFALGHGLADLMAMQHSMYHYHSTLVATHPYSSRWWQWPLLDKPISYFWQDLRPPTDANNRAACCVAEILALPNPIGWWLGIASVPFLGFLAWRERNKGYALIVVAYVIQWLPWIGSPRLSFEYHFFPNLALIVLANTILLERLWRARGVLSNIPVTRVAVGMFLVAYVFLFFFFFPVVAGVHVTWEQWNARMWLPHWII